MGKTLVRNIAYEPLPTAAKFHAAREFYRFFIGPVGSGKSNALAHEILALAYENPGRLGFIGAPTFPMLEDATLQSFREVLETNGIPYTELKSPRHTIYLKDISVTIFLRSLEKPERLRGPNLAWAALDEVTQCKKEAFDRLDARVRDPKAKRLSFIAAGTPNGFDWVWEAAVNEKNPRMCLLHAKPFENKHLPPDYYTRLAERYDERFYRQEVLAEFLNLNSGQVYYSFSGSETPTGNIEPAVDIDPFRPILWSLDFNIDPMCSVIAQEHKSRRGEAILMVLDEIRMMGSSTQEVAEEFRTRYYRQWNADPMAKPVVHIYGDAAGKARQHATGMSDYALLEKLMRQWDIPYTLNVPGANPLVRDRINSVNGMLLNQRRQRRLFLHPRCKWLKDDLLKVAYKPGTSQPDKDKDKNLTHISDALGYMIWGRYPLTGTVGYGSKPLF